MDVSSKAVDPIPFDDLEKIVLPLIAITKDAHWHPVGTAFVIAVPEPKRALLLTAAHNLEVVGALDTPRARHHATTPPDFLPDLQEWTDLRDTRVFALLARPTPGSILVEMERAWYSAALDVALMLVEIKADQEPAFSPRLALDTRPIEVGTPVMAVGYNEMNPRFLAEPNYETSDFRVELGLNLQYRTGHVNEICPHGAGIHRWPGFLVSFPLDSGMSGGPVIDLSGEVPLVRGIVGGDVSEHPESGARGSAVHAFASMLWPAMIIKTQINLVEQAGALPTASDTTLLDLVRHAVVDDRGRAHEHVRIVERRGTLGIRWD